MLPLGMVPGVKRVDLWGRREVVLAVVLAGMGERGGRSVEVAEQ